MAIDSQKCVDGIRLSLSEKTGVLRVEDADDSSLSFADGSFDVMAAITVLEFLCDPERALQEMVRCTHRPGGVKP